MSAVVVLPQQALIDQIERAAYRLADPFWAEDIDAARVIELMGMLSIAATEAQHSRLRGVPELLRLACAGLENIVSTPARVTESEWQAVAVWLIHLAGHCAQTLAPLQRAGLLDELDRIEWMPGVAPRMRALLLGRLSEGDEKASREPAVFEPEAFEPALCESEALTSEPSDSSEKAESRAGELSECDAFEPDAFASAACQSDRAEVFAHATIAAATNEPIWIAAEEVALARDAIAQQILPAIQHWWSAESEDERATSAADLEFHLGLLTNALSVIGLPILAAAMTAVRAAIGATASEGALALAEDLLEWHAQALQFLEQPSADHAATLVALSPAPPPAGEAEGLFAELARVRIGVNPSLIVAARHEATPEEVQLQIAPDAAPAVVAAMLRELPDNAARLAASIQQLIHGGGHESLIEAQRYAHTLKGDANAVGLCGLANLTHALEDVLLELGRGDATQIPPLGEALMAAVDAVGEIADHLLRRGPAPRDLLSQYQGLLDLGYTLLAQRAGVEPTPSCEPVATVTGPEPAAVTPALVAGSERTAAAPAELEPMQQVPVRLLKELLRVAGESIVLARQIEQQVKDVSEAQHELQAQNQGNRDMVAELDDLVAMRGAALKSARLTSAHELDPLELDQYNELHVVSRRLIESNSDQAALVQRASGDLSRLHELLATQARVQSELQRATLRTRTEPVSNIVGRLQRVVRQAARQLGKTVELTIDGEQAQVDSEILDRLIGALSHLLRNAVDHGIEAPELRRACGKPEAGHVHFVVTHEGDSVRFRMRDDGCGLDYDAIRQRATEAGLLDPQAPIAEDDLAQLVMLPGFSTRREATQVSGRGIGMDAVAQAVAELHGTLALHSEAGRGLEVDLRIPASLTSANVVLARSGRDSVALVTTGVSAILALEPDAFSVDADEHLIAEVEGRGLPAAPLSVLFDGAAAHARRPDRRCIGLLVDSPLAGAHVLLVEAVDDVRNVIVKNLEPRLAFPTAVRGVTVLGDGGMAAVIDGPQSIATLLRSGTRAGRISAAADGPRAPRVLVADDSLSVRRALEQLMLDAGFEVASARDGLEALNLVREDPPDVILADLEMPRLNGLDLTRYVRSNAATQATPVVMITSRATDKYRDMATDAGVTHVLGKPYQEDALVALVRGLIARTRAESTVASTYPAHAYHPT